jgi:hypothetical protein
VAGAATTTLLQKIKGKSIAALPSASTPHTGTQMVVLNGDAYELANIPASGTGSVTLAGDVSGASGACTVDKIKGKPVSNTAPATGNVLAFDGTQWAPATPVGTPTVTPVTSGDANSQMTWLVLRFGTMRMAWGVGQMKNGAVIQPPLTEAKPWNGTGVFLSNSTVWSAALSVLNTFNITFLHTMVTGNYTVLVDASGPDATSAIGGAYVTVNCFTTSST